MQKITRVYERHDLAVKAAHELETHGIPSADIALSAITATGGQHPHAAEFETADAGTGAIVAGPAARIAGTSEDNPQVLAEPIYGEATVLSVQTDDSKAPGVRSILDRRVP